MIAAQHQCRHALAVNRGKLPLDAADHLDRRTVIDRQIAVIDHIEPFERVELPAPNRIPRDHCRALPDRARAIRSEEHTSALQSLMSISYAVYCFKKKKSQ